MGRVRTRGRVARKSTTIPWWRNTSVVAAVAVAAAASFYFFAQPPSTLPHSFQQPPVIDEHHGTQAPTETGRTDRTSDFVEHNDSALTIQQNTKLTAWRPVLDLEKVRSFEDLEPIRRQQLGEHDIFWNTPAVEHVTTSNWKSFVHSADMVFIVFYDPASIAFEVLSPQISEAASLIRQGQTAENTGPRLPVRFGAVDISVDFYLAMQVAPEVLGSWQKESRLKRNEHEPPKREAFKFGDANFYPVVAFTFRNGTRLNEYVGTFEPASVTAYLERNLAPPLPAVKLETVTAIQRFFDRESPAIVGCFSGNELSHTYFGQAFNASAHNTLRGLYYFGLVGDTSLCAQAVALEGTDIVGIGQPVVRVIWKPQGIHELRVFALTPEEPRAVPRENGSLGLQVYQPVHNSRIRVLTEETFELSFDKLFQEEAERQEELNALKLSGSSAVDTPDGNPLFEREQQLLSSRRTTISNKSAASGVVTEQHREKLPSLSVRDAELLDSDRVAQTNVSLLSGEQSAKNKGVARYILSKWFDESPLEVIVELTPDNSFFYLEGEKALVIALVDKSDSSAIALESTRASKLLRKANDSAVFFYADGISFGPQFGLTDDDLPATILVDPQDLGAFEVVHSHENIGDRLELFLQNLRIKIEKRKSDFQKRINETVKASVKEAAVDSTQSELAAAPNTMRHINYRVNRNQSKPLEDHLTYFRNHRMAFYKKRRSFRAVYPQHFKEFGWERVHRKLMSHELLRTFASDLDDLLNILSEPDLQHELRRAIESRENILSRLLQFDANEQAAKYALRHDNKTEVGIKMEKLQRATREMEQSGANELKSQIIQLNVQMADLFNKIPKFLERKLRRGQLHLGSNTKPVDLLAHQQEVRSIPRVHHENLSVSEFLRRFAIPKKPVVITGLNFSGGVDNTGNPIGQNWDLDFFREKCGQRRVTLKTLNESSTSWGRLATAERLPLNEFIDTFQTNETRQKYYLHDWGLPRYCPEVFGEPPYDSVRVPKFFAQDYFQRNPFEGYAQSWPSLFIGAKGTESSMHIDSGGTNFWLYLLSGQKEWVFYDFEDSINLYQVGAHFNVDAFRPDKGRFPLESLAKRWKVMQNPGELVYIPSRCPHAVRNHEDILAISMNYVDDSNYLEYVWEQLLDESYRAVELFTDVFFPIGIDFEQTNGSETPYVTWGAWKGKAWKHPDVVGNLKFVG